MGHGLDLKTLVVKICCNNKFNIKFIFLLDVCWLKVKMNVSLLCHMNR